MRLSRRKIVVLTILILMILLFCWRDELSIKQIGIFGLKYELIKILLHSFLAFKLSNYLTNKFNINEKFKSIEPLKIFFVIFLLCNSYIITQYTTRVLTNSFINKEVRKGLNSRTIKLGPAGWGYEADSINYAEYKELTKSFKTIEIPKESELIFVHDWYERDFITIIEFDVPKDFDLQKFYQNDNTTLRYINELCENYELFRIRKTKGYVDRVFDTNKKYLDTTLFKRFKYEISDKDLKWQ